MTDDELLRYSRHILLDEIGIEGQSRLLAAHALVIGAGGLGSPVALYLGTAGLGRITLVDHDTVDLTNLQRQVAHTQARVGLPKVASAREAIQAINPGVRVDTHCYAGYRVPPFYDSLLAKLIAFGADRAAAYARARRALGEMAVEGLATSLPFHRWILDNDDFIAGRTSTGWTEQHWTPER